MQDADLIIGRDREIAQLDIAIGPGDDGLRLVMLSGPSGRGKTTLSGVVAHMAAQRGFDVAVAHGRAGSLSTPFAPWLEALPGIAPAVGGSIGTLDIEQVGTSLVRTIGDRSTERPLLLICDDVQAFDESSLALLPYACGVNERTNITVMLVEQSDAGEVSSLYRSFVGGLVARRVVQHFELGPMSDSAVGQLVRHVLKLDETVPVPDEIVLRAQGNPWFALELARAHARGETEIPVSIAAAATARLHRLDEACQDLVNSIAVCHDGAYIGWLEALADQKPREFVKTMDRIRVSGLVREEGDFLFIAHPLMRSALLDELSSAMKRALHQELAGIIPGVAMPPVTSARALGYHLAAAGRTDDAVLEFLRAAEANESLGQLHEALADYVRSLEIEPRIEQRIELLRRAGFNAMQLSDARAEQYWTELARLAAARSDNELYAYALYQQYMTIETGAAVDRLERAAALGPDKHGWSARAAATLDTRNGDYESAVLHDRRALELAGDNGDLVLETVALDKLGMSYAYLGRLPEAIESTRAAVALAIRQRLHSWAVFAWGGLAESLADNLESDTSVSECRSALKYVDDLNFHGLRPWALCWLALALARIGQTRESLEACQAALDEEAGATDPSLRIFNRMVHAMVAATVANTDVASEVVEEAVEVARSAGATSWQFEAEFARARYLSQVGRIDEAVAFLENPLVNEPVARGQVGQWLIQLAVVAERPELAQQASHVVAGISSNTPLVRLMIDEVECTAAAMEKKTALDKLCEVADRWAAAHRPLDAMRTLTSLAIAEAKHGKTEEAVARLRDLRAKFADLGMEYDANVAAAKLRALGARSRAKSRSTTVGNLTKRELEIARLVASGMKNAEVAQQLYLAEKTVAAHLSNIYGKVEVRSRVQLASWLKENDESIVA